MSDGPIKLEASAKIEIKTEVPADASGRLVHAALDVVSPLTEWLGMQGDKVRVHRHYVVQKMIAKAEQELALEKAALRPVPLKIAVPLIEYASQEEPDDELMIGLWAKLLASSASSGSVSPRFVRLLSEMNKRQAVLLTDIRKFELAGKVELIEHCYELVEKAPLPLNALGIPNDHVVDDIVKAGGPALLTIDVTWREGASPRSKWTREVAWFPEPERATDLGILESLGLLHFKEEGAATFPDTNISLIIDQGKCSPLAAEFLLLVGAIRPGGA